MKLLWMALVLGCVLIGGCGYYRITDPASGKNYYSIGKPPALHPHTGVLRFTDAKSGSEVTLQSSEVKLITPEEYEKAVPKK
jgi:hypothetical protein